MIFKIIPRRKIYISRKELKYLILSFLEQKERGRWVEKFEKRFAQYIGVKYAFAVPSGRIGLKIILRALKLDPGDEVIIPAYTLKDLIPHIHSLGLKAVPVDIDSQSFNLSPQAIEGKINSRTKVILATHIFGGPCEVDKILELAKRNSIFVIEDCAHSIGSECNGKKTGTFGDAGFFSLDTIKLVNTYGGGVIVTDDELLSEKIQRELESFKFSPKLPVSKFISAVLEKILSSTFLYFVFLYLLSSETWGKKMYSLYRKIQELSFPKGQLTDFQARVGLEKLNTLSQRIKQREKLANIYKKNLKGKVYFQRLPPDFSPNYYFLIGIISKNTEEIRKKLLWHRIDIGIKSEIADDCASYLGVRDCNTAFNIYHKAIQLPLFEGLKEFQVRYIIDKINNCL